jgi:hypothetical protein
MLREVGQSLANALTICPSILSNFEMKEYDIPQFPEKTTINVIMNLRSSMAT